MTISRRDFARFSAVALTLGFEKPLSAADKAGRCLKDIVRSPVVDVHAHLVPPAWFGQPVSAPRQWSDEELVRDIGRNPYMPVPDAPEIVANRADRLRAFEAARADGRIGASAAFMIAEMDRAGIDIAVNLCMDEYSKPFKRTLTVSIDRVLEDIATVATQYPGRIVNFFGVDPNRGKEGVALLERAVRDYGICGMGEWLSERWKIFPNDRAKAYPYLEKCAELGIPFVHNGSSPYPSQDPKVFEEILRDFPTLKVVNGAAGLLTDAERASHPDQIDLPYRLLDLAEKYRNFYLDLDDWQRRDAPGQARGYAFLQRAMRGSASDRVMFGSDFPVFSRTVSADEWVDLWVNRSTAAGVRFADADLIKFFSSNAVSMLDGPCAPAFIRAAARSL